MERVEELYGILAKLNNHHSQEFDRFPGVTGIDVAHALGTIKTHGPSDLGRVKWAGQNEFYGSLVSWVSIKLLDRERHRATPDTIGKDFHRTICRHAVDEFAASTICRVCNNQKTVLIQAKSYTCEHCRGLGHIPVTTKRHMRMHISEEEFDRIERHYTGALMLMDEWHGELYSCLYRNFGHFVRRFIVREVVDTATEGLTGGV